MHRVIHQPFLRLLFAGTLLAIVSIINAGRSEAAGSATLSIDPGAINYTVGSQFTVWIHEDSDAESVNAVQADLQYDSTKLQYISASVASGSFTAGPAPTGGGGNVSVVGGSVTSHTGDQVVGTVTFKILGTFPASSIFFKSSSAIVRTSDTENIWDEEISPWVFGQPYAAQFAGQSSFPTIAELDTASVFLKYKNIGASSWYDDTSVGGAPGGTLPVHLATWNPPNHAAVLNGPGWGNAARPNLNFTTVYESDGTTLASNQHVVAPGQIARYSFTLKAHENVPSGTYREYYQPISEGSPTGAFNIVGTYLDATVTAATYVAAFAGQSSFPSLPKGTKQHVYFKYKNNGNVAWYDDTSVGSALAGTRPVHLTTTQPLNRGSGFASNWGAHLNRPVLNFEATYQSNGSTLASNQHVVQPGEYGVFGFDVAPATWVPLGSFKENFMPILEGASTLRFADPGTYMVITVIPQTYVAAYNGQSTYPTMSSGTSAAYLRYKNNGNMPWYDDTSIGSALAGNLVTHLATSRPINRSSIFGATWGTGKNRPGLNFSHVYEADGTTLASDQHVVQPGQIGRFSFTLTYPTNGFTGVAREFFMPVVDGSSNGLFNDPGTYLDITVQ